MSVGMVQSLYLLSIVELIEPWLTFCELYAKTIAES